MKDLGWNGRPRPPPMKAVKMSQSHWANDAVNFFAGQSNRALK